jgi:hypothetical protein
MEEKDMEIFNATSGQEIKAALPTKMDVLDVIGDRTQRKMEVRRLIEQNKDFN